MSVGFHPQSQQRSLKPQLSREVRGEEGLIGSVTLCSRSGPGARTGPNFYQLRAPDTLLVASLEQESISQLTGNGMRYSRTTGYDSKTLLRMLRKPSNLWGPAMLRNSLP